MSEFNINIPGGQSKRLKTGGKYVPADILVTAEQDQTALDEAFAAGQKSEYDRFWDAFQQNGQKQSYSYSFYNWQPGTYNPKYDVVFGENNAANYTFAYGRMDTIPGRLIAKPKAGSIVTLSSTFAYSSIKTINKLVLDSEIRFSHAFDNCTALESMLVEGTIGQNGFDVQWSTLLTHDSLMSIINALKDYSGTGATYTVTLGAANLAKLSDAEKAIATGKGWTLA